MWMILIVMHVCILQYVKIFTWTRRKTKSTTFSKKFISTYINAYMYTLVPRLYCTYIHFLKKCIYTHTHIHINHTYFSFCMCMYKNTRSKKLERFLSQLVTIPHVPEMICLKAFLGIMDQVSLGRGLWIFENTSGKACIVKNKSSSIHVYMLYV